MTFGQIFLLALFIALCLVLISILIRLILWGIGALMALPMLFRGQREVRDMEKEIRRKMRYRG